MASDSFDIPCQKKRGRGRPQKGTGPKAEKRRKTEIQMEKCRAAAKYTREKRTSRRNVAISQASTLLTRFRPPPTFEDIPARTQGTALSHGDSVLAIHCMTALRMDGVQDIARSASHLLGISHTKLRELWQEFEATRQIGTVQVLSRGKPKCFSKVLSLQDVGQIRQEILRLRLDIGMIVHLKHIQAFIRDKLSKIVSQE